MYHSYLYLAIKIIHIEQFYRAILFLKYDVTRPRYCILRYICYTISSKKIVAEVSGANQWPLIVRTTHAIPSLVRWRARPIVARY